MTKNFSVKTFNYELRLRRFLEVQSDEKPFPEIKIVDSDQTLSNLYKSFTKPTKEELCKMIDYMCAQLKDEIMLESDN